MLGHVIEEIWSFSDVFCKFSYGYVRFVWIPFICKKMKTL